MMTPRNQQTAGAIHAIMNFKNSAKALVMIISPGNGVLNFNKTFSRRFPLEIIFPYIFLIFLHYYGNNKK